MYRPSAPSPSEETIAVLDFGSQYSQLIARRVRENHVYCELIPHDAPRERIASLNLRGFILSGGPASVYEEGAPSLPDYVLKGGLPILGICYGMQLLAHSLGGEVAHAQRREYGSARLEIDSQDAPIFGGLPPAVDVWMSHGDRITRMPPNFSALGHTASSPVAAMGEEKGKIYGLQFHPEVAHTPQGREIFGNFLYSVCGCRGTWRAENFVPQTIAQLKEQVGDGRVLAALSGGVDSAVTATLLHRAIGDRLICVFVDNGLLRLGEAEQVVDTFQRHQGMRLVFVNAKERFLRRLKGTIDPEEKRQRIGEEFVRVFEEEAQRIGQVDFLAQGTTYPDVIESGGAEQRSAARIKAHHNVGALPPDMALPLVEPLRYLFKDEVRAAGEELGLSEEIVWRHPFPGPGLAVRITGEVTEERLETLRKADHILVSEIKKAGLYREIAQALAVLTPVRSVGVMGDGRTYHNIVAIRAVTSEDFMTADWARLPFEVLAHISNRIVNEVPGVNRVVYDISSKPPSTIEWE